MARAGKIRWLSMVLGVALAISGVVALAGQASSTPSLPSITPQQLIASMARAAEANGPVSGAVTARIDLGLPSLPDQFSEQVPGAATLLSNLSGDHRLRVWHSADGLRVADLLSAGERALFVSRRDAWAWDSGSFTAYHAGPFPARKAQPEGMLPDPQTLAVRALAAISPSTAVSVGQAVRVAGRDAYVLVLRPRTDQTLADRVDISVDAVRRVALGVAIFPRNSLRPAISVAFTSVSFDPIKASTFDFTPPAGARVVHLGGGVPSSRCYGYERPCRVAPTWFVGQSLRVLGKGWSQVLAVRLPGQAQLASGGQGDLFGQLLPFSGPLFSVRLVDRGDHSWLLAGFVPQSALASVQAKLP